MERFVNRLKEMKTLESEYNCAQSSLVVIYGRRRVGKTTLISEFIKNKNALYYLVTQEQESQNRNNFKNMVADFIDSPLLKSASLDNRDAIFQEFYPNISYIESGNVELALSKIRQNLVDGHISYVYEDVCQDDMWQLNQSDTWPFHFNKIGRWWDNQNEEIAKCGMFCLVLMALAKICWSLPKIEMTFCFLNK